MLEKQVIQSIGFHNNVEGDKVIGFQLRIRLPYYRGIYLSQIRPGTLYVDGQKFDRKDIIWEFEGKQYSYEDLKVDRFEHWNVTEAATLKIALAGGLSQGFHDIKYGFCFTSSYMPPAMQALLDPDKELPFLMPEFGHHVNTRRLIIV
ncbi:C-glycoside deglycosidase beta subunit domain-containing protein [Lactiplantibacillus pentosus]|uniref:C-deglycosylation enzyme beta subunit n=1 Tax=Lactiplantibacillus pentosus TaxID=1589 RepID=A0AB37RIT0_LACPE|nr:DUF6379 domain-containing protein [Lactiplantibacillus pentosus]MBQ0837343.1 D-mannonate dehydratase [Lactiplantibacillus pentosus]MBU7462195.1 D-mannonate dehydratase [Lactiplantibacillus pentosus]MBU7465030.1 D-mannonate dehydratase [Lactiplantibacillus pentosus]MBU7490995.1 D-mannonate dehydratase [Lactiplantibacillus pentosus]MBU7494106.1 D-mannonate dehydratase [Lactiplantibacillus pentosus]